MVGADSMPCALVVEPEVPLECEDVDIIDERRV